MTSALERTKILTNGEVMKTPILILIATCGLLITAGTGVAQSLSKCNHIEFSELNTFSKQELENAFCELQSKKKLNSEYIGAARDYIKGLNTLAKENAAAGMSGLEESSRTMAKRTMTEIDAYQRDFENCSAEIEPVARMLARKAVTPKC